jgi:hypothetical protein
MLNYIKTFRAMFPNMTDTAVHVQLAEDKYFEGDHIHQN